jgi:hypothetical protein
LFDDEVRLRSSFFPFFLLSSLPPFLIFHSPSPPPMTPPVSSSARSSATSSPSTRRTAKTLRRSSSSSRGGSRRERLRKLSRLRRRRRTMRRWRRLRRRSRDRSGVWRTLWLRYIFLPRFPSFSSVLIRFSFASADHHHLRPLHSLSSPPPRLLLLSPHRALPHLSSDYRSFSRKVRPQALCWTRTRCRAGRGSGGVGA